MSNKYINPDAPLNEKDIQILAKIPEDVSKEVMEAGGGNGKLSYNLVDKGYKCLCTDLDIGYIEQWKMLAKKGIDTKIASMMDLSTYPDKKYSIVLCSQVLEHITEYQLAFKNLLILTENLLIITVPWRKSFNDPGHVNYWDDEEKNGFSDIHIYKEISKPYSFKIEKIYTKPQDRQSNNMNYLMVIDKRKIDE